MFRTWLRSPLVWICVFSVFIGVFLRLQHFGTIPVSLYWDEMAIWNEAQSIAQTGRDTHNRPWNQAIFISYGDFKMPAYIWLTSLVTHVVSDPLVGTRLVSLLAGLSLLASIPWLVWELQRMFQLWDVRSGLPKFTFPAAALFLTALVPVSLHFSRVGFEAHLGLSCLILAGAVAVRGLQSPGMVRKTLWLVLAATLAAFATYAYFSVRFVWPGLLGIFLFWSVLRDSNWKQRLQFLVIGSLSLGLWLILLVPLFQADFASESSFYRLSTPSILNDETLPHRVNQARMLTGNTIISRVLFSAPLEQAKLLWQHELKFTTFDFLFLRGDGNLRHGTTTTGVLWWWMAPFLAIGFFSLWRKSIPLAITMCLWWALGVLPAAVPNDVPHTLRSLNALPVLLFWTTFGVWSVLAWIAAQEGSRRRFLSLVLSLSAVGVVVVSALQWSGAQPLYAQRSSKAWQDGYTELAEYLASVQADYNVILVDTFDDKFFVYYQPVSGLSWQEIQEMPTQSFQRTQFGSVRLQVSRPINTAPAGSLVILKGEEDVPAGFVVKQRIMNHFGEEVFLAVEAPQI